MLAVIQIASEQQPRYYTLAGEHTFSTPVKVEGKYIQEVKQRYVKRMIEVAEVRAPTPRLWELNLLICPREGWKMT